MNPPPKTLNFQKTRATSDSLLEGPQEESKREE